MAKRRKIFRSIHDKARWCSDLMKADLEKVTDPEIWRWMGEYWAFIYGEKELGRPVGKQRIATIGFGETEPRLILKGVQTVLTGILRQWLDFREGKRKTMPTLELRYKIMRDGDQVWMENADSGGEANLIRSEIYQIIVECGLDAIRECLNTPCKILFIHTSKRQKVYCCQQCAWQEASRQRRQTEEEKAKRLEAKRKKYGYKKEGGQQ